LRLEGIHHVTAITGDAWRNVDFYTRVLGLRMVAKTVNQDDPSVYHLFYADERGRSGAELTFFEYPGAAPGRAGAGMVHRIVSRVGSPEALDFWAERLAGEGIRATREGDRLRFEDFEGLGHELVVNGTRDEPLAAEHPEIPAEHALQGFDGVRAYTADPARSAGLLLDGLGFTTVDGQGWEARGEQRGSFYAYDLAPPEAVASQGAGTVHHVAFASQQEDHESWRTRVAEAGAHPTPVIDRFYFRSVYFREPSGVLFEIATIGPGFAVDEDAEHLGERLSLPPRFEPLRGRLEGMLTPLPYPRQPV
jgi:glyoxalase family protein